MIHAFITSIKMLLGFDFFVYALVAGIALAIVFALFGTFVVMRKEANIAHAISHFALLGVSTALLMNRSIYPSMVTGALLGSLLISLLKKTNWFSHDSINEILAQGGLVTSIIVLAFVVGYKANIMDYLFGDILTITFNDVVSTLVLCLIIIVLFIKYNNVVFQVSFHKELAMSKGLNITVINGVYMFLLSLAIATSIKVIGVLLVTAFLIIPVNVSKLIAHNYRQSIYLSVSIAIVSVIIGLFGSYFLDIASGAMIVGVLIMILFFISLVKSLQQKI